MVRLNPALTTRIIRAFTPFLIVAATMMAAHPEEVIAEEFQMPDAIAAEPDENLKKAWKLYHDREIGSYAKGPITEAATLLKMKVADGPKVSKDTFNTSFAYRLIAAKMPQRYGSYPGEGPASNVALRHFDDGVRYLYRQQSNPARMAFAKGIFSAAQLGEGDFKAFQHIDIKAKYDKGATSEMNVFNIANIFMDADLNKKEKLLRVVTDKFSTVNADNAVTDWKHPAYQLKALHWNFGFFISAHWLVGNSSTPDDKNIMQEALDMRNTDGWAYKTLWRKFKYHTNDMDML